ncbi:MAG: hypothetical protein IKT93_03820 [Clostridia bacterium]|nr:hypothetical protein [Clostridia bacterium]
MAETVLLILLLFPSMLGLAELIHLVKAYILAPKVSPKKTVVVYLYGEYAVEQLKLILDEYNWQGEKYAQQIIAVDCGIESSQYAQCEKIACKNQIIFCKEKDLANVLK